jgi:protocatechuate 3,4-dioxygenase alpha subunit
MSVLPTPGQTVGPFFGYALPYDGGEQLVPGHHPDAVRLSGTVFDGAGTPIPDALVEIWQPDARGTVPTARGSLTRDGYSFTGFGRSATTRDGRYSFTTVEPGALADSASAPFFSVIVFARGLTDKLHTRIYLPEADGETDPLLSSLPPERRDTLIATRQSDGSLHHDIHLQGETETVFLDFG